MDALLLSVRSISFQFIIQFNSQLNHAHAKSKGYWHHTIFSNKIDFNCEWIWSPMIFIWFVIFAFCSFFFIFFSFKCFHSFFANKILESLTLCSFVFRRYSWFLHIFTLLHQCNIVLWFFVFIFRLCACIVYCKFEQ